MEEDLQSTCLSRGRVALSVGPRCLLRPDPPPLFRLLNTPPLISNRFWALRSMRQVDGGGDANDTTLDVPMCLAGLKTNVNARRSRALVSLQELRRHPTASRPQETKRHWMRCAYSGVRNAHELRDDGDTAADGEAPATAKDAPDYQYLDPPGACQSCLYVVFFQRKSSPSRMVITSRILSWP